MNRIKTKIELLFFLFFSTSILVHSQDLIITEKGDSLNCKITKIKENDIYFAFKSENEIKNTSLQLTQIKKYQYAFYPIAVVPAEAISKEEFPRFRAGFHAGLSYRTGKIDSNFPSSYQRHLRDLKSGGNWGLDAFYYFSKTSGIGLKYSVFHSKAVSNIEFEAVYGVPPATARFNEETAIDFIGVLYSVRFWNKNKKNCFVMNVGLGYMGYKDNLSVSSYDMEYYITKGSTLGLCLDAGYDIGIAKNLALGFQISYFGGALMSYEVSNGTEVQTVELEEDNYESLARVDFNIGLRFTN